MDKKETCCKHHHEHHHHSNVNTVFLIIGVIFFIAGFKFSMLFLIAYIFSGYDIIYNAVKNLFKGEMFDENFLMSIATIGALLIGEAPEAVTVMILYKIGEYLQDRAVNKSKKEISSLIKIKPLFARKVNGEQIQKVSPDEVQKGDIIQVAAGEKIALDGIVTEGNSFVDTSSLTGESKPQFIKKGDKVYSGTINLDGILKIKATSDFKNSTVSKILELVETSSEKKASSEKFITRFARIYTPVVVFLAVILAFIPPIFTEGNQIERALTFLVISCPCALVISIPLSFFAGIGKASSCGILIKGGVYIERLSEISNMIFDKTGTLTKGMPEIVSASLENEEVKNYLISLEKMSTHPIANAVKHYFKEQSQISPEEVKEHAGMGLEATINGKKILIGNSIFTKISKNNITDDETTIYITENGILKGELVLKDKIKTEAKETISLLNSKKIKTTMLTGDSLKTAKTVQEELNIDNVYANLLPIDKVDKIETIMSQTSKGFTAFAGDGINDAPVLMRADIGIAMGGLGSDAALEAADVIIMNDNLLKIITAINLSKKTMNIVKQNIIFILFIKILFLTLCAMGLMTMWGAVFADVGITFITILNSLRLLK